MDKIIIDLNKYKTPNAFVFVGRDRGKQVREKTNISKYINSGNEIEIIIPDKFHAVCPSFYEELLYEAKVKYKQDKIILIHFKCDNSAILDDLYSFVYGHNYKDIIELNII